MRVHGSLSLICVVEDAIEALLKISDSEPEQTVGGQGERSALPPLQKNAPHSGARDWTQHLYEHTSSYFSPEWNESTIPSHSGTHATQYSYSYSQTYPYGGTAEQATSGYGDSYLSGFVSGSGGHAAYGHGGQQLWASDLSDIRQGVEGSSLLDTPSSSGSSSVASSPSHAPQRATVSYSHACSVPPKKVPHSPKTRTSPLTQSSKCEMNV